LTPPLARDADGAEYAGRLTLSAPAEITQLSAVGIKGNTKKRKHNDGSEEHEEHEGEPLTASSSPSVCRFSAFQRPSAFSAFNQLPLPFTPSAH
jgi:hypothetical protein